LQRQARFVARCLLYAVPMPLPAHLGTQRRRLHAVGVVDDVCDARLLAQLGNCRAAMRLQCRMRQAGCHQLSLRASQQGHTHTQKSASEVCAKDPFKPCPPATTSSAARGAKQLVVVTMQAMASAPSRPTSSRMACMGCGMQLDGGHFRRLQRQDARPHAKAARCHAGRMPRGATVPSLIGGLLCLSSDTSSCALRQQAPSLLSPHSTSSTPLQP